MTKAQINKLNKKLKNKNYLVVVNKFNDKIVVQHDEFPITDKGAEQRNFVYSVIANETSFDDIYYSI